MRPSPEFRSYLCSIVEQVFQTGLDDWQEMVGTEVSLKGSQVRVLPAYGGTLKRIVREDVLVLTRVECDVSEPAYFVFPNHFVAYAIAKANMLPEGKVPSIDPGDEATAEAARELMNLFCGSATRALSGTVHKRTHFSQSIEHLKVQFGAEEAPDGEQGQHYVCASIDLEAHGTVERAWCVLPPGVIARWNHEAGEAA